MSAAETQLQPDGLSSVKLVSNAKGDVQIEVKIYAPSNTPEDIAFARSEAERIFDAERAKYKVGAAA